MDSVQNRNFAATSSSNIIVGTTTISKLTNNGQWPVSNNNSYYGIVVKDNVAAGDSMSELPKAKSPLPIYTGQIGFSQGSDSRSGYVFNPNINISPSQYQRPFLSGLAVAPIFSYGLNIRQDIPTLTLSNNDASTAGATGGGDAPYLGAGGNNSNRSDYINTRLLNHCLNEASCDLGGGAAGIRNNETVQQKLTGAAAAAAARAKRMGRYSRKVFVGGLPPDISEEQIIAYFERFGQLIVDWPHKITSKSKLPPKGYAFLIFHEDNSVQQLIDACVVAKDKLYLCISSTAIINKPVQIRPWRLADSSYIVDVAMPVDPRKMVFVGGVPRPLKAYELAIIMYHLYGNVSYAAIDSDSVLQYPKGVARVAFSNKHSYIAAISARYVQLQYGDIDKSVEIKPYVLGNQMCDECHGQLCCGRYASLFCTNITCLKYYCEHCWTATHSHSGREYHKPLFKEAGNRSRVIPFR